MGKKLTITGSKIFDIGYRYFLAENALGFGIERFRAVNLRNEGKLLVFVDGDGEALNEFVEFAKSSFPEDAQVDSVEVEDYKGYVPKIDQFLLLFNVQQSRKFIEIGKEVRDKVRKMREKLGRKIDGLRADIKTSVEKRLRIIEEDIRKIKAKKFLEIMQNNMKNVKTFSNGEIIKMFLTIIYQIKQKCF